MTDTRALRAQLDAVRQQLTRAMVQLTPDSENTTPQSQAWAALADAYQQVDLADAFLAVDDATEPPPAKPFRHLRAVQ